MCAQGLILVLVFVICLILVVLVVLALFLVSVVVIAPTGVVLRLLLRAIWVTPDLGSTQAILPEAN